MVKLSVAANKVQKLVHQNKCSEFLHKTSFLFVTDLQKRLNNKNLFLSKEMSSQQLKFMYSRYH